MNMTTKAGYAAIVLAAAMLASSARAGTFSLNDPDNQDVIGNGSAGIANVVDYGAFSDTFSFKTDASAYISNAYISASGGVVGISTFAIYDLNNALVGTAGVEVADVLGHPLVPDTHTGLWYFSDVHLAANTDYYVKVAGNVSSLSGSSYSGTINVISAVPEPETYALMLGGLGLIGFLRRRKGA